MIFFLVLSKIIKLNLSPEHKIPEQNPFSRNCVGKLIAFIRQSDGRKHLVAALGPTPSVQHSLARSDGVGLAGGEDGEGAGHALSAHCVAGPAEEGAVVEIADGGVS